MKLEQKTMIEWQCQQLLNRITMYTDGCNWQDLAECYTEDAVLFRPSDANNGIEGRQAIYDSLTARPPKVTSHLLANCVFEVVGETQVKATSRVWLIAGEATGSLPVDANPVLLAGGFVDDLVLLDEQWLINQRKGSLELKFKFKV